MIDFQLYAHLNDLISCEYYTFKNKNAYQYGQLMTECHFESITKNGILKQLKVQPNRLIAHGNQRYCAAQLLGIDYLPIDLNFLLGLYGMDPNVISLRDNLKLPFHTTKWDYNDIQPTKSQHYPDMSHTYGRGKTEYANPPTLIRYKKE